MNHSDVQAAPSPPNLIKALKAGFDTISNHIWLILFPVVLDLFLWMGPHLRIKTILEALVGQMISMQSLVTPETEQAILSSQAYWQELAERINLFSALRSFPIGIPSLMVSRQPLSTPLGTPQMWEISSIGTILGVWLLLFAVGVLLGTLYFITVGQASLCDQISWRKALSSWPRALWHVLLLVLLWAGLMLAVSIPASCLVTFAAMLGLGSSTLIILLYLGLVLWVIFPLIFSPHGITAYGRKMWVSVAESVRLTRYTLPTSGLLFLIILLLGEGMDYLWNVPEDNSWITILGVAGHAFIATSLLATSFIYYRDASQWMQSIIQPAKISSRG